MICDACNCKIDENDLKLEEQLLAKKDKVKHLFFSCPYCNTQYTVSVTTTQLRKRIKDFKYLRTKQEWLLKHKQPEHLLQSNYNRMKELQKEVTATEQMLRKEWLNE